MNTHVIMTKKGTRFYTPSNNIEYENTIHSVNAILITLQH